MSTPLLSIFFIGLSFFRPVEGSYGFEDLLGSMVRVHVAETSAEGRTARDVEDVARFYELRDYRPVWIEEWGLTLAGEEVLGIFRTAGSQGLDPDDYLSPEFDELMAAYHGVFVDERERRAIDASRIECYLTASFVRYSRHRAFGRSGAQGMSGRWGAAEREEGFLERLVSQLEGGGPRAAILSIETSHPMYRALQQSLGEYRRIAAAGGWARIPPGPRLAVGAKGNRVAALRARLQETLKPTDPSAFDRDLQRSVKKFQRRHGLSPTGKVDPATLEALNAGVEDRIRQIELSLERARAFPATFGPRYILVNIPDATLSVVEDDSVVLSMRAGIGKTDRQTPVLVDTMTSVVFNPTWNIPPVIIAEDILPKVIEDSDYLEEKNIRVLRGWAKGAVEVDPDDVEWEQVTPKAMPYRFLMASGPQNPLGDVKFLFPNAEHVYIHDSPQRALYRSDHRLFSSGCVRVERARDLAAYLLRDSPRWSSEKLAESFESDGEKSVSLKHPIPVYFIYLTAWVGEDGALHFRPDIYGRDELLAGRMPERADRRN
jgi:murein L,D-transpeptidase YcbB/YkuD